MSFPTPPPTPVRVPNMIVEEEPDSDYESTISYESDEELVITPRNILPELYKVINEEYEGRKHTCHRNHCLICLAKRFQ